jgi:hypothetical protein
MTMRFFSVAFHLPSAAAIRLWIKKAAVSLAVMIACLSCTGMMQLSDEALSNETGQALFQMNKQVGTGAGIGGTTGVTFYTINLNSVLSMNLNIANLQLGVGGSNAAGPQGSTTDISGSNVSFGCVANASGVCITSGAPGGTAAAQGGPDTIANRNQLINFVLTNPYMQFAVSGDNSAANRHVVGVRLGAQGVSGPISFGSLNSFSGYLSGTSTITMYGNCGANPDQTFCAGGIPATNPCGTAGGSNATFPGCSGSNDYIGQSPVVGCGTYNALSAPAGTCVTMGLADSSQTLAGLGAWMHELAVGFPDSNVVDTSGSTSIAVAASGLRQQYAGINHINFNAAINNLVNNLSIVRNNNGLGGGLTSLFLPALKGGVTTNIQNQLKSGLNPGNPASVSLGDLSIPYNLNNIHQLNINSSNFGLSFQAQSLSYPGYVDSTGALVNMNPGWSMYAAKAFTIPIAQSTWDFTNGIIQGGARNGNIVSLPAPYVNCWGSSTFC